MCILRFDIPLNGSSFVQATRLTLLRHGFFSRAFQEYRRVSVVAGDGAIVNKPSIGRSSGMLQLVSLFFLQGRVAREGGVVAVTSRYT